MKIFRLIRLKAWHFHCCSIILPSWYIFGVIVLHLALLHNIINFACPVACLNPIMPWRQCQKAELWGYIFETYFNTQLCSCFKTMYAPQTVIFGGWWKKFFGASPQLQDQVYAYALCKFVPVSINLLQIHNHSFQAGGSGSSRYFHMVWRTGIYWQHSGLGTPAVFHFMMASYMVQVGGQWG